MAQNFCSPLYEMLELLRGSNNQKKKAENVYSLPSCVIFFIISRDVLVTSRLQMDEKRLTMY